MKIVQFFGILLMCLFLSNTVDGYALPGANPRLIYRMKSGKYIEFAKPVRSARALLHKMNLQHLHLELMQAASTPDGLLFEMKTFDEVAEILQRWKTLDTTARFYKKFDLQQTERRFTD